MCDGLIGRRSRGVAWNRPSAWVGHTLDGMRAWIGGDDGAMLRTDDGGAKSPRREPPAIFVGSAGAIVALDGSRRVTRDERP